MPIYEYKCRKCGYSFERLAKNSSDHPGNCPECGETEPKKLFSSFAPTSGETSSSGSACGLDSPCGMGADSPCAGGNCPF